MTAAKRVCAQCGKRLTPAECRVARFPNKGAFLHGHLVCSDTDTCRARWWGRLAFELELNTR